MMRLGDTIAAIATARGEGAVALVRVSGPDARSILRRIFRPAKNKRVGIRRATYGHIHCPVTGAPVDEVIATYFPAPYTYTREPICEVTGHGGHVAPNSVLQAMIDAGARLAAPGEFTFRAFVNGRIDLSQAEAVIDLVRAPTVSAAALALGQNDGRLSNDIRSVRDRIATLVSLIAASIDFVEDGVPPIDRSTLGTEIEGSRQLVGALLSTIRFGRIRREGVRVVIVGAPNAGKSSLFNALLREHRAIVSPTPGTTRDTIEAVLDLDGQAVVLIDTAGWPVTDPEAHGVAPIDPVEVEGVARGRGSVAFADIVLAVADDQGVSLPGLYRTVRKISDGVTVVGVRSKIDLLDLSIIPAGEHDEGYQNIGVSAKTGAGMGLLISAISETARRLVAPVAVENAIVWNPRHIHCLTEAENSLLRAGSGVGMGVPDDLIAIDLRDALSVLGEITGHSVNADLLDQIFQTFCIGK